MTSPPFAFGRCRGHVFSLPPGAASSRWPRSARNWHGKISGTSGGHFWRTDNIRFANRVRLINRSFRPKTFCSNVQRQTGMWLFRGNHNPGVPYEISITSTCRTVLRKRKFALSTVLLRSCRIRYRPANKMYIKKENESIYNLQLFVLHDDNNIVTVTVGAPLNNMRKQ